jgi:predicted nucleic acid-binding protein
MPTTVIYDANVLYPNTLRDLLIRVARAGLVHGRWTERILDEMSTALRRTRPDIDADKVGRLRALMTAAVRDCLVEGYDALVDTVDLPDKDDRHVVAAAITAGAQTIVTWNLRDFPTPTLAPFGIEALTPDDFLFQLACDTPEVVYSCIQQIADARTLAPQTVQDVMLQLERDGLIRTVTRLNL